jgi:hypothetical protein
MMTLLSDNIGSVTVKEGLVTVTYKTYPVAHSVGGGIQPPSLRREEMSVEAFQKMQRLFADASATGPTE